MTTITHPVRRRTRGAYAVLYRQARHIVVSLLPGDLLSFREAKRRQSWQLPVDAAFRHALAIEARAKAAAKRARRGK